MHELSTAPHPSFLGLRMDADATLSICYKGSESKPSTITKSFRDLPNSVRF